MSKKKHDEAASPRKPSRLLIWCVKLFNKKTFTEKYGLTIDRSALAGVEPPYLVLFNHVGDSDHYIVGMTLYPQLANYMVSRWVQHSFPTGPLSKYAGAIHKDRFIPDVDAVIKTKRVFRKRHGIVAIAPAASYSIDGTPNYFDYGVAKLIKLFKVPVYAVRMDGLYMFKNRFCRKPMRCKLSSTVVKVLDTNEANEMDVADIFKRVYEACDFNDFQYQERVKAVISADDGNIAEGMEYVAYKCLNCGAEFKMESRGDRLYCTECGNAVRVNQYYFFEPTAPDTVYVKSLDRWNRVQKRCVEREIRRKDFCISSGCALSHYTEKKPYGFTEYGRGTLTLTREGFTYKGTDKGAEVEYTYPLADTPYVGSVAREYLSFDGHEDVCRYKLDDMRMATKYLLALRIMRLKFYPDFEGQYEWYESLPTVKVDDSIIGVPHTRLSTD